MKVRDKIVIWFLKREAGGWRMASRKHEMKMKCYAAKMSMHEDLMRDTHVLYCEKLDYIKVRENESKKTRNNGYKG